MSKVYNFSNLKLKNNIFIKNAIIIFKLKNRTSELFILRIYSKYYNYNNSQSTHNSIALSFYQKEKLI